MKELEKLIMAVVTLIHAPTVLPLEKEPLVLIGWEAGVIRIECTPPQNYYSL
jgi:hypothetical protein